MPNITQLMSGKLTYRTAYVLMAAGLYLISYQVGDLLDAAAVVETRQIIADVLRGEGFKTLLGGIGLYGLRRALANGALTEPEEKELTPEEQKEKLREMYDQFVETVEKAKEPKQ